MINNQNRNNNSAHILTGTYSLVTVRAMVTGEAKLSLGKSITILPTEVINSDGHLSQELDELFCGDEINVRFGCRHAALKVVPHRGKEFIVMFDKDENKSNNSPSNQPGDEFMLFIKLFSQAENPAAKTLNDRCHALSWTTTESYSKATEAAAKQNEALPEMKQKAEEERSTLWRMTSEQTGINIDWAIPERLSGLLELLNGKMVPTDAKWYRKDRTAAVNLVKARKEGKEHLVKKYLDEVKNGTPSKARPAEIMMLRSGNNRFKQASGVKGITAGGVSMAPALAGVVVKDDTKPEPPPTNKKSPEKKKGEKKEKVVKKQAEPVGV
jgi:hypothetical protein